MASASEHPLQKLQAMAANWDVQLDSSDFARLADINDPLGPFRKKFSIPKVGQLPLSRPGGSDAAQQDSVYLCGNSLGLMPLGVEQQVGKQLQQWGSYGVFGHRHGYMPWAFCDEWLLDDMAAIVGATPAELCMMNGLTVNLHILLTSMYRPSGDRTKILLEQHAFPSDHYAFESQIRLHGLQPNEEMICIAPRDGEHCIRTEDVMQLLETRGHEISVVCLPGIQYYTGQLFHMQSITSAARARGCIVGWDLAHAVGNVPMQLHDWGVDFAVWCTYKYLNCGAGSMAGAFLHERHLGQPLRQLDGWWGHRIETRFNMDNVMQYSETAGRLRLSNPSMIQAACVRASLDEFKLAGMPALRTKSLLLTAYLEYLVKLRTPKVSIITPDDPEQRGAQLSLLLPCDVDIVMSRLHAMGVACDERQPRVIRVAPAPIYNSFTDVFRFMQIFAKALPHS